jgi:hypothetical protein
MAMNVSEINLSHFDGQVENVSERGQPVRLREVPVHDSCF